MRLLLALALLASCGAVRQTHEREIARGGPEVWAVLADGEQLDAWLFGLGELTWIDDEPAVGEARDLVLREGDTEFELRQTITHLEPGRAFGFELDYGWARFESLLELEPAGEATRVVWDTRLSARGMVHAWALNLFQGSFRARFEEHLDALAALAERGAT